MSGPRAGRRILSSLAIAAFLAGCSAGASPTPVPTATPTTPTSPLPPVSNCAGPVEFTGVPAGWAGDTGIVSFSGVPAGWFVVIGSHPIVAAGGSELDVTSGFGGIELDSGSHNYQWFDAADPDVHLGWDSTGTFDVPVCHAGPTPTPLPTFPPWYYLNGACDNGNPVPWAADYAGKVHPLVVTEGTQIKTAGDVDINSKWYDNSWPGPIQLVVCLDGEKAVMVDTCGSYTRESDGVVGELDRYRWVQVIRVVVAETGKTLQSETLYGNTPACSESALVGDGPPWKEYGSHVSGEAINQYATSVSTQAVK
jgi:hypothetical protein